MTNEQFIPSWVQENIRKGKIKKRNGIVGLLTTGALLVGLTVANGGAESKLATDTYQGWSEFDRKIIYVFDEKGPERKSGPNYALIGSPNLKEKGELLNYNENVGKTFCFEYTEPIMGGFGKIKDIYEGPCQE